MDGNRDNDTDKMVLNDCKKRHTNLGMTWIDFKKDYQKTHISGRQFVTIAICDLYDALDPDIKKPKISIYLEKWRKVEPPFVYE